MTTTPNPEFEGQPQDPQSTSTADPSTPPPPPAPSSIQGSTPPPPPPAHSQPENPQPGHVHTPPAQPYPQPAYQQQGYQQPGQGHPAPATAYGQQVLDPAQQRQWGMFAHVIPLIAMVLSAGLLGFVGSLVIYVMYKDRGDFVRQHAANSLNIQIMTGIVLLISFPLMLVLVGFATYFIALAIAFVLHIIGALRANEGQQWSPPLTPRFVS
ncbi:DUF4870 domain-containing protein [Knoellia sp. LjRoot47]|uniref:DUF4870 domain-containing protein n=1 Tax=Knoellia sp. LjRoot47 TaxID=3342330 RepID=UPI003ECCFC34